MAKILRTEQLSVNGDNIRLTADQGNLIINSVSGDDITQITSTVKIGQDISSLSVRDTGFDTDVSSLASKNSEAEALAVTASKYGAYGLETSNLSTGSGSSVQTITLSGRSFISKPIVTASLTGTSNDPILAVMVSDVSETSTSGVYQATFQFSDELPATGETDQATSYKLNIVACVSGTDADLDTIIDSMDSDRDGDGVENSLDYDPDSSSPYRTFTISSFDDDEVEIGLIASSLSTVDTVEIANSTTDKSSAFKWTLNSSKTKLSFLLYYDGQNNGYTYANDFLNAPVYDSSGNLISPSPFITTTSGDNDDYFGFVTQTQQLDQGGIDQD
jgi:hypothetical protein